ncbi:Planctomycete cytochrome C [Stieleria maiorica]|uniref:Planctomycete cytochrome C n=1 Tax=Stieleria maiorica TaxID=2795974 RepID=A0A5B9MHU6_9BACT|nr:PSD1 and planctomycete cytochrome C domain-containing protein [Stieleria maiorica]QEG00873.1 Planctomycete cytochrome C [Stieleria maiorica]
MYRLIWLVFAIGAISSCPAADVDFDSQVRPILSDKCFHCHGPDEATRAADLRLDTVEGALEDRGGYAAVVPGDLENSEALRRVLSDDPDEVMPPPDSKLTLSAREKSILQEWIGSGAHWSEHWSFVAPQTPAVPEDPSHWSRNEIDRFVRSRAIAAGVAPQAEADRETLIRRVSLDLTGLPPSPAEVDAFLADKSDGAYERLVDRLLASPRYGERMAWEWLDAARYADTDGFQGDPTRTMWPWRDWLVDALNDNMPFDQFTIEMLAGDLMDNPTPEQILATGFNRNHMFNGEGGRIAEETRVENVFDRAETTGTVWLGLTMTCCRCHDHKFDPISLEEYFQFYAFFDNTSETGRSGRGKTAPVLNYLDEDQRRRRDDFAAELQTVESELTAPIPNLDAEQAVWEIEMRDKLADHTGATGLGPWWQLGPIPVAGRQAFDRDLGPEKAVDLTATVGNATWQQLDDFNDGVVHPLPETVGATYFYRKITSSSKHTLQLSLGSDDAIKVFFGGKQVLANYTARAAAADQELLEIELEPGENDLLIKIVNTGGIGGFYFQKTSESVFGLPAEIVAALKTDPNDRQPEQRRRLREHFRSAHWPAWKPLSERRDRLKKQLADLEKQAVTVMVMDDLPDERRRKTLVLERGGYDKPTDVAVDPGTPAALPPLPADAPRNRLTLARWLVDPTNPLTARVTVNRYWQTFFGRGIVESTEDFGLQGNRPTHPDLLDWLAVRFVHSGWNVKQLHKLIVMSATYRQSSNLDEASMERDPQNKWFARAPRYRLPSWMLRDQALAVSGLLTPKMGGPAVKPYQPEGIWAEATFGKIRYTPDSGQKLYRRSLYIFWRRIVGPTMFFDGAKRQTCEVKPTRTNTPLHALTTLNETTFVESARMMAERVLREKESRSSRLTYAFRLATARKPTKRELDVLESRVEELHRDFAANPDDAMELVSVGQSPRDPEISPAEHAAYTLVCSILLNLDETLSKH